MGFSAAALSNLLGERMPRRGGKRVTMPTGPSRAVGRSSHNPEDFFQPFCPPRDIHDAVKALCPSIDFAQYCQSAGVGSHVGMCRGDD
jgi:hypothetical protein